MQNIENYLNSKEFKSRAQLRRETGLKDRPLRREIEMLKKRRPVIYNSDPHRGGYRLARPLDNLSPDEVAAELTEINHCIADIEARKSALSNYECSYIAYAKVAEKRLSCAAMEACQWGK